MVFVLDWQKKLGYHKDPFIDEPTADIVGMESLREKSNLFLLKNHQVGIISGDEGMGKSSFILWLRQELKGKRRVRQIPLKEVTSAEKLEQFLDDATVRAYKKIPFYDKIYQQLTNVERTADVKKKELFERLQKEQYLFIIEDADKLSKPQVAILDALLETKAEILLIGRSVKNPFSKTTGFSVELKKYTEEEMKSILEQRISKAGSQGTFPFDSHELKKLFKKAEGNPKRLIHLARERAIELSLKGLALPKKEKEATKPRAKSLNLFGNIKIEMRNEDTPPKAPKKQKTEHSKKEEKNNELSEESLEDAELLKQIVEQGLK